MRQGVWVLTIIILFQIGFASAQNGTCVSGDCKNGYGKMQYTNGTYQGHFVNGNFTGSGKYSWNSGESYDGNFENGHMQGQGTMGFKDGTKYKGSFDSSQVTGQGTYYLKDGSIDKTKGYGKNIELKLGCIAGDCENGIGTRLLSNGKYAGEFVNGKRYGNGKYDWDNGSHYDGSWAEGQMHGTGTYTDPTGRVYKGRMYKGAITKEGSYYLANGKPDSPRNDSLLRGAIEDVDDPFFVLLEQKMDYAKTNTPTLGAEMKDYKCSPASNKAYACVGNFSTAINGRVEKTATGVYIQISEFYSGKSKVQALYAYRDLEAKLQTSFTENYHFQMEASTNQHIMSLLGGLSKDKVATIPTFNLRLDKVDDTYIVLLEIGNKEMQAYEEVDPGY